MIYFARAEGTRLIKIGYTAGDAAKRIAELQTGCPYQLVLLATVPGTARDEKKWHKRFAADREKGEWFKLTRSLASAIRRARDGEPVAQKGRKLFALSLGDGDELDYAGEIVSEGRRSLRLDVYDGLMLYGGALVLSGELRDVPRNRCRIFSSADAFGEALARALASSSTSAERAENGESGRCQSSRF